MFKNITKLSAVSLIALLASCHDTTEPPSSEINEAVSAEPTPELPPETIAPDNLVPDMSTWTIVDGTSLERLDDEPADSYRVAFTNGASLIGFDNTKPVKAGETITASFLAWSEKPDTELRVRIARHCSGDEIEQTVEIRKLETTPMPISVTHTFERDHDCARLQFDTRQDEASYSVSSVIVKRD